MFDIYDKIKGKGGLSVPPAAKTSNVTGSGVDLAGYEGAVIEVPVGAWTNGTHTCVLKESSDNSTYTTVAAADILGTQPTITGYSNMVKSFGYKGSLRYIRVDFTVVGAPAGAIYGAIILRGLARDLPVVN